MTDITMTSVINKNSESTMFNTDKIPEDIMRVTLWMNVLEAHITALKAKIAKEREPKRSNQSNFFGDCTVINQTFNSQVQELWTAVQNFKTRTQNETCKLLNLLAPEILGPPLPNPEIESFRRQIIVLGEQIAPVVIIHNEVTEEINILKHQLMEKQKKMAEFIADVGDKMEQTESQTHPRKIQKHNERLMKIKICQVILNNILAGDVDFDEHPELLDIKNKWIQPITLESETS